MLESFIGECECTKKYPNEYKEQTDANVNGYPMYRRRKGTTAQVRNRSVDNRNVIPYNKQLTFKYNCHINVEICSSIQSVKYLYKYVYKGYDSINVELQQTDHQQNIIHDEPARYLDARYVSAPEAMWRLLENKMYDMSHSVIRLPVHLNHQHLVYFTEGNEEDALNQAETRKTRLTAWFKLNEDDGHAQQFLYTQIPYHYVFNKGTCKWKSRKQGENKIIPRMYSVSPRDIERFHLRLLLLHVPGAISFEDLRTVNGEVFETFQEAADKHNLLANDNEWMRCLDEAAGVDMPSQLRQTFALICAFNKPENPVQLYQQFENVLIEDFERLHSREISIKKCLQDIEMTLRLHGLSCTALGLPDPGPIVNYTHQVNIVEEQAEAEDRINSLNHMQQTIFQRVIDAIDHKEPKFLFLDGPGGSGKTYLYSTLMSFIRGRGQTVLPFATTGIAADLLTQGRKNCSQWI